MPPIVAERLRIGERGMELVAMAESAAPIDGRRFVLARQDRIGILDLDGLEIDGSTRL
jgi:hypothetical protein